MKFLTHEEMLDKHIGKVGTPKRDDFDSKVKGVFYNLKDYINGKFEFDLRPDVKISVVPTTADTYDVVVEDLDDKTLCQSRNLSEADALEKLVEYAKEYENKEN